MNRVIVFLLVVGMLFIPNFNFVASFADTAFKIDKIVIDAGHGGKDPGALGSNSREKDITLAVSLKLGAYIRQYLPDVEIHFTRDDDTFVPLVERGNFANKHKADFFISVHINSFSQPSVKGCEVYVLGLHKSEENLQVAKRENAVILMEDNYKENYDGFDPNKPESHIMLSMFQNAYMDQSIKYAEMLENEFRTRANRRTRGVKQAGFVVLHQTTMPSVLVELGFLTNPEEESYLLSDQGQSYLASAMFRSFRDYKEKLERKSLEEIAEKPEGNPETPDEEITPSTSAVEESKSTEPKEEIEEKSSEVLFKVQFCATKSKLEESDSRLKKVDGYEIEKTSSGYNRYLSGSFTSLEAAKSYQNALHQKGLKDAYIAAYLSGKRVSIYEAKNAMK